MFETRQVSSMSGRRPFIMTLTIVLVAGMAFAQLAIVSGHDVGMVVAPMTSYNSPTCTDGSINAPTAWDSDENLGSDGAVTFYFTWDATYFYVAWLGVDTVSSDNVYVAFDENPGDSTGATAAYGGASFTGVNLPDYAVVMQWGVGANAVVYNPSSGSNWGLGQDVNTWDHYAAADTSSANELRIPRSYLGILTTVTNDFAVWMWATNNAGDNVWATWPTENPSGGVVTFEFAFLYASSDAGRAPNAYGLVSVPEFAGLAAPVVVSIGLMIIIRQRRKQSSR
jgi:hypothetical protein